MQVQPTSHLSPSYFWGFCNTAMKWGSGLGWPRWLQSIGEHMCIGGSSVTSHCLPWTSQSSDRPLWNTHGFRLMFISDKQKSHFIQLGGDWQQLYQRSARLSFSCCRPFPAIPEFASFFCQRVEWWDCWVHVSSKTSATATHEEIHLPSTIAVNLCSFRWFCFSRFEQGLVTFLSRFSCFCDLKGDEF